MFAKNFHKGGCYLMFVVVRVPAACTCNGKSFCTLYKVNHWEPDYHMVLLIVFLSLNTTVISFPASSYAELTCMIYKYTNKILESKN